MHRLIAVILIGLTLALLESQSLLAQLPLPTLSPRAIRDPKTKILYYLEPDLRSIDSISPDGKVLWRCLVITPSYKPKSYIEYFCFDERNRKLIDVWFNNRAAVICYAIIDKQSGALTNRGCD